NSRSQNQRGSTAVCNPINDIEKSKTNGEKPWPIKYAEVETNDWLWVMSTIDGKLVLDGKGGI
ncbi:hypothetical protein OUY40_12675, partial [Lactococcus cremoris]|uniref:hypothetical protein n=1 Tax=Lactococcus lactis subsp. cremoris TaxID=1359 RepID=UPI0022B73164